MGVGVWEGDEHLFKLLAAAHPQVTLLGNKLHDSPSTSVLFLSSHHCHITISTFLPQRMLCSSMIPIYLSRVLSSQWLLPGQAFRAYLDFHTSFRSHSQVFMHAKASTLMNELSF